MQVEGNRIPLNPAQPEQNRQIRVFISSTFRDMQKERDLLVKEVFPALRRICAKRFVTFTEVDLRWGIPGQFGRQGARKLNDGKSFTAQNRSLRFIRVAQGLLKYWKNPDLLFIST